MVYSSILNFPLRLNCFILWCFGWLRSFFLNCIFIYECTQRPDAQWPVSLGCAGTAHPFWPQEKGQCGSICFKARQDFIEGCWEGSCKVQEPVTLISVILLLLSITDCFLNTEPSVPVLFIYHDSSACLEALVKNYKKCCPRCAVMTIY